MRLSTSHALALALTASLAAHGAQAASLAGSGYFQNFDGMGATGTAAPADWSVWTGNSGTTNATRGSASGGLTPARRWPA